jgi:hypothetical protein
VSSPVFDFLFDFALSSALIAWMVWGWVSWRKFRLARPEVKDYFSIASFSLASAVATAQIVTVIYAMAVGGFPFMDPTLLKIYRFCFFTGLISLICSLIACGREKSPLRWKALILSTFLILLVIVEAAGE